MTNSRTHRASFLQAFHTGVSESARQSAIESGTTPVKATVTTGKTGANTVKIGGVQGTPLAPKVTPETTNPADEFLPGSPKQVNFIKSLAAERNLSESDLKIMLRRFRTARSLIDALMSMPKPNKRDALKEVIAKATEDEEYVPTEMIPGFYRDSDSQIWKVQFNQSGTGMYALRKEGKKKYTYEAGAIRNLTPEMFVSVNPLEVTLEEAKAYGRKTGNCYMCSRTLTKQSSIDNGIGPICASKF